MSEPARSLLALCLALAWGCAPSRPAPPAAPLAADVAAAPAPDALRSLVTQVFAQVLQPEPGETVFPGVVIGILRGGERHVLEFGTVDVAQPAASGEPVPPQRLLFPIASLTKPVTAALLARLAARGDLDLDAPAVDCAAHPNLCPDGQPVTWRRLATHDAGFPVLPGNLGEPSEAGWSRYGDDQLREWLAVVTLDRAPGAGFAYSTASYAVLGLRLADVQGRSYSDLLSDEVLAPLGMRDARFTLDAGDRARLALGHDRDGTLQPAPTASSTVGALAPSGGLVASVPDLLAFLEANIRPTDDWRAPVDLLLRPHEDVPSFPPSVMALGWHDLVPAGFYWHAGHGGGHHGFMAFHPAGQVGVVVLTNSATSFADTRVAQASFMLLGALLAAEAEAAAGTGAVESPR